MKTTNFIFGLISLSLIFACNGGDKSKNSDEKTKTDSTAIVEKKIKTDLTVLNLIGKVKSTTETEFKAVDKFGEVQKSDLISKTITLFDEDGNRTDVSIYKADGSLDYKNIFKHNDSGRVIEADSYKSDGSLKFKGKPKYDYNGNRIEMNVYKPDGTLSYTVTYKYDNNDNLIEKNTYKIVGKLDSKVTYKYDIKSNKINEDTFDATGKLSSGLTYKYDTDKTGNWTKQTSYKNSIPQTVTDREILYY
jgi:hypothetical protein